MFKCVGVFILSMCFCATSLANKTADDFAKSKAYAKSLSATPLQAMHQFHPETTFKNYNDKPEQQQYYQGVETEKTDLSAPASNALKEDTGGNAVVKNFGQNQFEINQNNDAIKRAKLVEDESYTITHGLSNDRIQCDEKPKACEIKTHTETCHTSQQLPDQQCAKKRIITVTSEQINQQINITVGIAKKWTGFVTANIVTGAIGGATSGYVTPVVHLNHPCENMTVSIQSIRNNGQPAGWVNVIRTPTCANNGLLTLNITKKWDRAYPIQIVLTAHAQSKAYVSDEHWDNGCDSLEGAGSLCHVANESCTDSNATRVINGLPITRDCWEKTATFSCASAKTDECIQQREKKCLQSASKCSRMENNTCAVYEQTYNCFDTVCPAPIACVKELFCADGDCTEHAGTQNDTFGESITPLAVVGEAGTEYGKTQAMLFSGHAVHCKIIPLDFIDCCSEKGWGKKIDLAHCSNEDKALGKAKLNYLAHYVGEYCADKVLGVCTEYKRSYCVFDTKMARIIQEEGRLKQLNSGAFGSAETPNCGGMSVAELQRLDMGRIEFLTPEYPFNSGTHVQEAGIVVPPPNTGKLNDEVIRRIQKKVGG